MQPSPPRDTAPLRKPTRDPRLALGVALGFLAVLFHLPLVDRVPAADQLSYLAELDGDRSPAVGLALLDYGRERQFNRGDEMLYRPLLIAVLAIEHTLFGSWHPGWNVVNLAVHGVNACLVFLLLARRIPPLISSLLTACFALAPGVVDLVAWHHLVGYLLAGTAWLVALHAVDRMPNRPFAAAAVLLASGLAGVLLYEISVVSTLGFGVLALLSAPRAAGGCRHFRWLFLLPAAVYAIAYLARLSGLERPTFVDDHGAPPYSLPVWGIVVALTYLGQSLAPGLYDRTVEAYFRTATQPSLAAVSVASLLPVLLLVLGLAAAASRPQWRRSRRLVGVLGLVGAAHLGAVAIGRDLGSVWISGYHTYLVHLLVVLALAQLVDPELLDRSPRRRAAFFGSLAFWLAALISTAAPLVLDYHWENAHAHRYLKRLREIGRLHPSRRIEVTGVPDPIDPIARLVVGYPEAGATVLRVRASRILLPDLFRRQGEVLRLRWNGAEPASATEPSAAESRP